MNPNPRHGLVCTEAEGEAIYEKTASYQVKQTTFLVERVFRAEGTETVGSVLIKLLKRDAEKT